MTLPLHSAVPRNLIPKNLAGIIHSETVKLAEEKLAVIERLAQAAGVQAENVRQSNDHAWKAIIKTAKDKQCDLIRDGVARTARRFRDCTGQPNTEGVDSLKRSRVGETVVCVPRAHPSEQTLPMDGIPIEPSGPR